MKDEMSSIPGFTKGLKNETTTEKTIGLIVGDVGFSYMAEFQKKYPKQYINAGITEQSFMGIAAGLAKSGFKPYVYSMVPFIIMRNYEQLRNDVCYGNENVKLIGVRGSVHYRFQGMSHNLLEKENEEDLLKNLPNIQRFYPKDTDEVKDIILKTYQDTKPTFIRL